LLNRVAEAMKRLDGGIIHRHAHSWQALADQCSMTDLRLLRLAVDRIRSRHLAGTAEGNRIPYPVEIPEVPVIPSSTAWRLNRTTTKTQAARDVPTYDLDHIPTEIEALDILLCPGNPAQQGDSERHPGPGEEWLGGFYAPTDPISNQWLSPVVAVEGSSGNGKTTLSTQIACNLVRQGWVCLFYSLEQEPERVLQSLRGYSFFSKQARPGERESNFEQYVWVLKDTLPWHNLPREDHPSGRLILPLLTPRPVKAAGQQSNEIFEERYSDLEKSLEFMAGGTGPRKCFYFIDSLTAFSSRPLSRDQVHRMFSLFRTKEAPLLVTLERQRYWSMEQEQVTFNHARYLSDIVISLESGERDGYFGQTIEVNKSRYSRRILGKHLMKLKSHRRQTIREFDDRFGVVIYPSVHYQLSRSLEDTPDTTDLEVGFPPNILPVGNKKASDKNPQLLDSDSCIVISGPHGKRKQALGLNLLFRRSPKKPHDHKRKLIISLAEERKISLKDVALLADLKYWKAFLNPIKNPADEKMKVWSQDFGRRWNAKKTWVTVLHFRMGQILAEEFFYIIEKYLQKHRNDIDAVLFADTARLRTGFPFLASHPLFLPAMVDLIKSKGLVSIFIDVQEKDRPNEALLAAADCRIFVKTNEDQEIFLRFNNVRGKDYDQRPRRVTVTTENKRSVLKIDKPGTVSKSEGEPVTATTKIRPETDAQEDQAKQ